MPLEAEVILFIRKFNPNSKDIQDVFTGGCCYWFAHILMSRFFEAFPTLMYDEVANHFGVQIGFDVYDITGIVTREYNWIPWCTMQDEAHKERIIRDCINF